MSGQIASRENQSEFSDRLEALQDSQDEKYRKIIYGDPEEKRYDTIDDSIASLGVPNYYKQNIQSKYDNSYQYYLKTIKDIESKIYDGNLDEAEKIRANNLLEEPEVCNKGYCFVTFAATDEAKRVMINLPSAPTLLQDVKVELKKESGHIDYDKDYFYEIYEELRNKLGEEDLNLVERVDQISSKREFESNIAEFRDDAFDNKYKESLLREPVKKQHLEPEKSTQDILNNLRMEEKHVQEKVKEEMESYLEKEVRKQISSKDRFELNLESDDEDSYQVGRSFSAKITRRDFEQFMSKVEKKAHKEEQSLLNAPQGYAEAVKDLVELHQGSDGPRSEILDKFSKFIDKEHVYSQAKKKMELAQELDQEVERITGAKMIEAARKKRLAKKRAEREAAAETEDTYFDPFKKFNRVEKIDVVSHEEEANKE